jgi:hypothetical protein
VILRLILKREHGATRGTGAIDLPPEWHTFDIDMRNPTLTMLEKLMIGDWPWAITGALLVPGSLGTRIEDAEENVG